jgi:large conductance mechanosensitive channel
MLKGFREFILRGNVIDLAVAVVIGAAFTAVVTSIVTNFINPLISAVFKQNDLSHAMVVTLNGSDIKFGAVLGAIINFLIVAVVVYFVFVYPLNQVKSRLDRLRKKGVVEPDAPVTELDLLTEIRDLLRAQQAPPSGAGAGKHADPRP